MVRQSDLLECATPLSLDYIIRAPLWNHFYSAFGPQTVATNLATIEEFLINSSL